MTGRAPQGGFRAVDSGRRRKFHCIAKRERKRNKKRRGSKRRKRRERRKENKAVRKEKKGKRVTERQT